MAQTTLRLEYSAFFSSGLLAQHNTPQKKKANSTFSWDARNHLTLDYSPSRPSSPIPIPDDSLMDIDTASPYNDSRSITPTPRTKTPMQSPQPVKTPTTPQPKPLRKRRSSLTLAISPMNTIRSPTRTANNALQLQLQLLGPASPIRSRSGSLSGDDTMASRFGNAGVASTETSLGGRLIRSGSIASTLPPTNPLKRRPTRRMYITALPAPSAPPPTIPLPALPLPPPQHQQHFRPTNLNTPSRIPHTKAFSISSATSSTTSARARGLSVSSSTLDGDEHRIDEDMKEN